MNNHCYLKDRHNCCVNYAIITFTNKKKNESVIWLNYFLQISFGKCYTRLDKYPKFDFTPNQKYALRKNAVF